MFTQMHEPDAGGQFPGDGPFLTPQALPMPQMVAKFPNDRPYIASVRPDGGTPIGNAMITAKGELDATGLARRHLLVVTDGENTDGFEPDRVAAAIGRRPEAERPSIYDFEAREAGGLVLAAANARELNDTLDALLRGKILIEK